MPKTLNAFLAEDSAKDAEKEAKRDGPELFVLDRAAVRALEGRDRYVVTSAMNNCAVDKRFWQSLQTYCARTNATLLVVPIRYRNPSSPAESKKQDAEEWWPEEVRPFLVENCVRLHKRLYVMADVPIAATATNPLSGLDPLGKGSSVIFGHAQIAQRMIPTPHYSHPKMLATTGTVSVKNYSRSKAGKKAEFHHSLGAMVIEVGDAFYSRHLVGDRTGCFYDLDGHYTPEGFTTDHRPEAIIFGDIHEWWINPAVKRATFTDEDSLVRSLRPLRLVMHDLIDSYSVSHHHKHKVFTRLAKHRTKMGSLLEELTSAVAFCEEVTPEDAQLVVVGSNHHDHIRRFVEETDWREDLTNAEIYLQLALQMVQNTKMTKRGADTIDPFEWFMAERLSDRLRDRTHFVGRSSYRVKGVELGMHGDAGPNGARGSIQNISRIGARSIIGHSHTAGVKHGVYQVGTSTGELEYSRGSPSSWSNTHAILYPNSKRTLVTVVKGRWRAA